MFNPTHFLVSRSKKTPVQLISAATGLKLLTEAEWQRGWDAAFEMHLCQGFLCRGVSVVGFKLEPIALDALNSSKQQASSA